MSRNAIPRRGWRLCKSTNFLDNYEKVKAHVYVFKENRYHLFGFITDYRNEHNTARIVVMSETFP